MSITVGVHPAQSTNAVDVEYRINGGPGRVLPGRLVRDDHAVNAQFFRAVFPYLPAGSSVEYAPILRNLGRRIGSALGRGTTQSFSVLPAVAPPALVLPRTRPAASGVRPETRSEAAPAAGALRRQPRSPFPYALELLAQVHCFLAPPEVIGATPDGLRVYFRIREGRVSGDRFNATIESGGGDALRIREDGTAIVAVTATLMTDDGTRLFTEYSGVLELGEDGYQRAIQGSFPRRPQVYLAPRFVCASPAYEWLNRLQCMGIGYVTMPELEVNYDLYAMRLVDAGSAP